MQYVLAQWAVKVTAMACNANSIPLQLSDEWRHEFFDGSGPHAPPVGSHVWLGRHRGIFEGHKVCLGLSRANPLRTAAGYHLPDFVLCTLSLDHLVVHVGLTGVHDRLDVAVPEIENLGKYEPWLLKIWPAPNRSVIWPKGVSISNRDIFDLAHRTMGIRAFDAR